MTTAPHWTRFYEPGVPATVEIPDIPLYQILDETTRRFPNNTALRLILKYLPFGLAVESTMTYAQLQEGSERFAAALHALGIRKGDRVAIMLPNIPEQVVAYFGILKAGGVVVNTNPLYTPRELTHQLSDSGAETLITLSGLVECAKSVRSATVLKRIIVTDVVSSLPWLWKRLAARAVRASGMMADVAADPGIYPMDELMRTHPAQPPAVPYSPDDLALLQYTGGTTGAPRAAMLTQRNIMANLSQIRAWLPRITLGAEKMLGAIPFFHVYGMSVAMLTSVNIGAELIMTPNPRETELVMQIISKHRVTFYPGVPAMYVAILNHPNVGKYDLRSVDSCLSGGAALPLEVARRFEALTGGHLVEGYGLSECSPVAVANPIVSNDRREGSTGVPIPSTTVELVALEPDANGEFPPVAPGEQGELVIYGPQVMKGYWNSPEDTAKAINKRGGLHTGDIAKIDEDGYVYIVDRKKDLIIAGGFNIVPREVEEVLFMHPKVQEAVVVGVPHPRRGETVKAFVVLKPGETSSVDEIRAFCKEQLAPYKVPTEVEFRTELPKSQVGKVLRRLLVEEEKAKQAAAQEQSSQAASPTEGKA